MRKRRNYAALLLAAAIVFQGGLPTYAAEPTVRTITIYNDKGAVQSHTYEAYRIFTGDYTEKSSADGALERILSNIDWDEDFDSERMIGLLLSNDTFANKLARPEGDARIAAEEVAAMLAELTSEEVMEFAALAEQCLTGGADGQVVMNEGAVEAEIMVPGDGYYLVKDQDGSLMGAESDAATFFLLTVAGDAQIKTKSDWPSITKKIVDTGASHWGKETDLVDTNEAAVGDRVTYELNATIPSMVGYDSYTFIIHERLSDGLTFDEDSVEIYLDGDGDFLTTMTGTGEDAERDQKEITSEAELITPEIEDGCSFELNFKDFINHAEDAGKHIIVRFQAVVNDNAVTGDKGNPNTVTLEFSNYPGHKSTGTTPEDTVITYVSGLDILKLDAKDNAVLSGAEFVLYVLNEDGTKTAGRINRVKDNEDVGYFQFDFTENDDGSYDTHTFVTGTDGTISIRGLRAGSYVLEEVKPPAGYNSLLSPISLNLSWEGEDEVTDGTETAVWTFGAYGDGLEAMESTEMVKCENGIVSLRVLNNKGVILPETGGTGVVALYAGGILLMLLLLVWLNWRKRENEGAL